MVYAWPVEARMLYVITLLTACWTPTETGPNSMVGHILSAQGSPLQGITVNTVESQWTTDEVGHFAVNYKPPSQFLHFDYGGLWYKRNYSADDDQQQVQLTLPNTTTQTMSCETSDPCQMSMTWTLAEGFTATFRARCDPDGEPLSVPVPEGAANPETSCRTTASSTDVGLHTWHRDGHIRVTPPPVSLQLDITTDRQPPPTDCVVTIDGEPVASTGPGTYRADVFGHIDVQAACEGIPALPRRLLVRQASRVSLPWSRDVPTIDALEVAPWAQRLTLQSIHGRTPIWSLELQPTSPSLFRLPPLVPGGYVVWFGEPSPKVRTLRPTETNIPGVLEAVKLPYVDDDGQHLLVGVLTVNKPLPPEPVTVTLHDATQRSGSQVETP